MVVVVVVVVVVVDVVVVGFVVVVVVVVVAGDGAGEGEGPLVSRLRTLLDVSTVNVSPVISPSSSATSFPRADKVDASAIRVTARPTFALFPWIVTVAMIEPSRNPVTVTVPTGTPNAAAASREN